MKNALILLFLLLPVLSFSQSKGEFELTAAGFVNKADKSLNYLVLDYPGVSKTDLYKKTLLYLSKQFASPKDVLSTIENESIIINAIDDRIPVKGYSGSFKLNYTMTIEFKDGKLRIMAPAINSITGYPNGNLIKIGLISGDYNKTIFNEKSELKLDKTKQVVELIFKAWIIKIAIAIEKAKKNDW